MYLNSPTKGGSCVLPHGYHRPQAYRLLCAAFRQYLLEDLQTRCFLFPGRIFAFLEPSMVVSDNSAWSVDNGEVSYSPTMHCYTTVCVTPTQRNFLVLAVRVSSRNFPTETFNIWGVPSGLYSTILSSFTMYTCSINNGLYSYQFWVIFNCLAGHSTISKLSELYCLLYLPVKVLWYVCSNTRISSHPPPELSMKCGSVRCSQNWVQERDLWPSLKGIHSCSGIHDMCASYVQGQQRIGEFSPHCHSHCICHRYGSDGLRLSWLQDW